MRRRTKIGALGTAGLVAIALFSPLSATADIQEAFTGSADGQILDASADLGALSPDAPQILGAQVSTTEADADNTPGAVATRGYGRNLFVTLGGEEIPIDGSTAEQTAPPDNEEPESVTLADLSQADPLLTGGISTSTAWARDPAAISCPSDGRTTVSEGTSTTTDLGVLNLGSLAEDPELGSLISVTDGSGSGTLESTAGVYIGTEGQVIGESTAPAVQVDVAGQVTIEVLDPIMTATATGVPGTASVDYNAQVRVNGEVLAEGEENTISLNPLTDVLAQLDEQALDQIFGQLDQNVVEPATGALAENFPLFEDGPVSASDLITEGLVTLEELLEFLDPTLHVRVNEVDRNVAEDGTSASGSTEGVVAQLTLVNTLAETETELVSLALLPLSASATVPAGGIDCGLPPLTVEKDGPESVQPGETFTYTIDVTNDTGCDVTDVIVTDEITGPDGFEVSGTSPAADSVDGGTVTWNVGDMADGATETFTVDVTVPDSATAGDMFADTATASGNCDGRALPLGSDTLDGPAVQVAAARTESLPRTGGGFALLGLAAAAAAGALRRR